MHGSDGAIEPIRCARIIFPFRLLTFNLTRCNDVTATPRGSEIMTVARRTVADHLILEYTVSPSQ